MGERLRQPNLEFPGVDVPKKTSGLNDDEKEHLLQGDWCGECDMTLGTGTCVRCVRIKNSRGGHSSSVKVKRKKVVRAKITRHEGPGTPEWDEMHKQITESMLRYGDRVEKVKPDLEFKGPGSPAWEDMKRRVSESVAEHKRRHEEYEKRLKAMTPEERGKFLKESGNDPQK